MAGLVTGVAVGAAYHVGTYDDIRMPWGAAPVYAVWAEYGLVFVTVVVGAPTVLSACIAAGVLAICVLVMIRKPRLAWPAGMCVALCLVSAIVVIHVRCWMQMPW